VDLDDAGSGCGLSESFQNRIRRKFAVPAVPLMGIYPESSESHRRIEWVKDFKEKAGENILTVFDL